VIEPPLSVNSSLIDTHVPDRNTHHRWYFGSIYRLVGLIDYKRPHFCLIAGAIELSWRPEGDRLNRGALHRVFIL